MLGFITGCFLYLIVLPGTMWLMMCIFIPEECRVVLGSYVALRRLRKIQKKTKKDPTGGEVFARMSLEERLQTVNYVSKNPPWIKTKPAK